MKKTVFTLAFCAIAAIASAQGTEGKANPWPWDFPKAVSIEAEPGQKVLSCYMHYNDAVKKGEELFKNTMIFYSSNMEKVGDETSLLGDYGDEVEVPNALIIPLDKQAKAKKGDIVLTWWQSGSGMQRAIVIDDSTPTEPVVCYLDLSGWPDDPNSPKLEEKRKGEKLKPGTFNVIKSGKWQSGDQVAYHSKGEWNAGRIIHVDGDKILVSGFASYIDATTKDRVKVIPFKEKIKEGDQVSVVWVGMYRPGYVVVKVDDKYGRIYVKKEDSDRIECKSIAEVTKVLN